MIPVRSDVPLGTARRGVARPPRPVSLLAFLLLSRFASAPHARRASLVFVFLCLEEEEGTGPGKLPQTGDLSTGKLSGSRATSGTLKAAFHTLLESKWTRVISNIFAIIQRIYFRSHRGYQYRHR